MIQLRDYFSSYLFAILAANLWRLLLAPVQRAYRAAAPSRGQLSGYFGPINSQQASGSGSESEEGFVTLHRAPSSLRPVSGSRLLRETLIEGTIISCMRALSEKTLHGACHQRATVEKYAILVLCTPWAQQKFI